MDSSSRPPSPEAARPMAVETSGLRTGWIRSASPWRAVLSRLRPVSRRI
ncbi:hypothetical protein F8B43_2962 [Methylorubrum populi]|uniref:Uncharacterized protein n=1 Tax=Methylorubrum populi TaxID=223967 RepID=A0A833J676_9HYPH|nr:hypothetical protein F8B43_2962 [Methylorubrum populi]